jgi:hypothetical protein
MIVLTKNQEGTKVYMCLALEPTSVLRVYSDSELIPESESQPLILGLCIRSVGSSVLRGPRGFGYNYSRTQTFLGVRLLQILSFSGFIDWSAPHTPFMCSGLLTEVPECISV